MVRDDLREEVLTVEVSAGHVAHLRGRVRVGIRPSAKRQSRHMLTNQLPKLPRVADTPRRPDAAVAAQDNEGPEPLVPGALRIRQTKVERVLGRQERNHVVARHIASEIDDQVAEVVLLARPDGAVGQKHEGAIADEASDGMVGVDPGVSTRRSIEFRPRRSQFDGQDGVLVQRFGEARGHHASIRDAIAMTRRAISRNMDARMATALATLMSKPVLELVRHRTPIDRLSRLERALGPGCPRLLVKRDDLLPFALGGNKVRKLQAIAGEAQRAGVDTLITCGAVQSNHARVTAATGAVLGWPVILVLNGACPDSPVGNVRYDLLFGAELRFVSRREDREAAMAQAADDVRQSGGNPLVIPVGGSTAVGAMGMARAVAELGMDSVKPDVIVHASSSGGTQAGLVAGCALFGNGARVIGVSADEPAAALADHVTSLLAQMAAALGGRPETLTGPHPVDVDDTQVGSGYGAATPASIEAARLLARTEGIVLDDVYTSKAMAGLIAQVRSGRFPTGQTVLFWHTGGMIG